MEVSTLVNWKSGKIVCRQLSPLARVYRRNNYIPIAQNFTDLKGIMNKFLGNKFEPNDEDETSFEEFSQRQGFSSPQIKQKKPKLLDFPRVSMKIPGFKIKRAQSKPIKEISSAFKVKKVTLARPGRLPKNQPKFKQENSNYTSYSNIYKNLLEKVPLIC